VDTIEYTVTEKHIHDYSKAASQTLYVLLYPRKKRLVSSLIVSQMVILCVIAIGKVANPTEPVLWGYLFWSIAGVVLASVLLPRKQKLILQKRILAELSSEVGKERRFEIGDASLLISSGSATIILESGAVSAMVRKEGFLMLIGQRRLVGAIPEELLSENTMGRIERIFVVACQRPEHTISASACEAP
jgi:hypothetical protein